MATEFSEVFWTFFITTVAGLLLKGGSMLYKSKCKKVGCCGCVIERDVEAEVAVDVAAASLPPPNLMSA